MLVGACEFSIAPATQLPNCKGASCDAGTVRDASSTLICPGSYVITNGKEASQLAQCTQINGSLTVINFSDPALTLPELRTVGGTLEVTDNPTLENLSLTALEATADLKVHENAALRTLTLPLFSSAEVFEVHGNPMLRKLSLEALVHLAALRVYDHPNLSTVALSQLSEVGGDLKFQDNASLQALTFPALWKVHGDLVIYDDLRTLGLPTLEEVVGGLNITQTLLTSVEIPRLKNAGDITCDGNPALLSIVLPALMSTTEVEIGLNPLLNRVELPLLARLEDGLSLYSDPALVDVAFPDLRFVNKLDLRGTGLKRISLPEATYLNEVQIEGNESLASLDFPKVWHAGSLSIGSNESLSKIDFPLLTEAEGVSFADNAALDQLSMPLLETVDGSLAVERNSLLVSVALPKLAALGNVSDRTLSLRVLGNVTLVEVSLPLLTTLTGSLRIDRNAALATLALPSLTTVTIDLSITQNPQLPMAQANAIVSKLVGFEGNAQIADNLQ